LSHFAFQAVIAALKVTISVRNKSYTSCNAAVSLCAVAINVTDVVNVLAAIAAL